MCISLKMEPRTAAFGERLWLGDEAGSWHDAHHRSDKLSDNITLQVGILLLTGWSIIETGSSVET